MPRVLSGIQPTGAVHLGNYVGAFSRWAREPAPSGRPRQPRHACSQASGVSTPTASCLASKTLATFARRRIRFGGSVTPRRRQAAWWMSVAIRQVAVY
ncbi:MAG: hypothetical protein ACRDYA_10935 [Egibacteraceae bacterium]